MIASLRGLVQHLFKDNVVVDVNGVGYQVFLSQRHLAELPGLGEQVQLYTHLVHREDAMLLFGFPSLEERELFLLLNSVSGIGAKTALGVLSALSVPDVVTMPTLTLVSSGTANVSARRSRSAARLAVSSACSGSRITNSPGPERSTASPERISRTSALPARRSTSSPAGSSPTIAMQYAWP